MRSAHPGLYPWPLVGIKSAPSPSPLEWQFKHLLFQSHIDGLDQLFNYSFSESVDSSFRPEGKKGVFGRAGLKGLGSFSGTGGSGDRSEGLLKRRFLSRRTSILIHSSEFCLSDSLEDLRILSSWGTCRTGIVPCTIRKALP